MNVKILTVLATLVLAVSHAPAHADDARAEIISEAKELIQQEQYAPAIHHLLAALAEDESLLEDSGFSLALAEAYLGYTPTIDPAAGGHRLQVENYASVVRICRGVMEASEEKSNIWWTASLQIEKVRTALMQMGFEAIEDGSTEELALVGQTLIESIEDEPMGGYFYYQAGEALRSDEMKLGGLRAMVRAGSDNAQVYTSAAVMELTPEVGGGAEAAVAHMEAGLAVLPDDLYLMHDYAGYLFQAGRTDDALAALQSFEAKAKELVEDEQERVLYVAAAGMLYDRLGMPTPAEANYKWVLERDPSHVAARFNLATIYINRAAAIQREINNLPFDADPAAIDARKAQSVAKLQRARPHLEYLDANAEPDSMVLLALTNVYAQLDLAELAQAAQAKREKLLNGEPLE